MYFETKCFLFMLGRTVRKAATIEPDPRMSKNEKGLKQKLIDKGLERNDEWGHLIVGRLQSIIDLPAEETWYHLSCHTAFVDGWPPVHEVSTLSLGCIYIMNCWI